MNASASVSAFDDLVRAVERADDLTLYRRACGALAVLLADHDDAGNNPLWC